MTHNHPPKSGEQGGWIWFILGLIILVFVLIIG